LIGAQCRADRAAEKQFGHGFEVNEAPGFTTSRISALLGNEAMYMLAEGVASRASDIDVVLTQGYGFPRWEGGPVFWARQQDRATLALELKAIAGEVSHGFKLADLRPLLST
jgi:3-hydroxyacyl-CoA dehydrogenase